MSWFLDDATSRGWGDHSHRRDPHRVASPWPTLRRQWHPPLTQRHQTLPMRKLCRRPHQAMSAFSAQAHGNAAGKVWDELYPVDRGGCRADLLGLKSMGVEERSGVERAVWHGAVEVAEEVQHLLRRAHASA
eukprot:260166-Pleurochrysis_carterae.AAC.1